MPIHKVEGGWKWGEHGHVYPTREGAEKQAEAAYAHGYKGDAEHTPVSERQRRAMYAAAEGKSRLGIPEKMGKEFTREDNFNESEHPRDKEGKFSVKGLSEKSLGHGELNIPDRTKNINHDLDKYNKEQSIKKTQQEKTERMQHENNNELAKNLYSEYEKEIISKYGHQFGENKLKELLQDWVVWQPAKFISFVEKFKKESEEKRDSVLKELNKKFAGNEEDCLDCAGILFRKDNKYLLIRRADNGMWEAPGGHAEEGESFEEAAIREACEEIGDFPDGNRWAFRESGIPGIHYVTFLQDMDEFILPTLSDEHVEYMWADSSEIPESIHPEVMRHIDILNGTEFDIENAIVTGELFSPQHFENVWLFDVRVTGTGTSYRMAHEEYVYRPPENFLTPEFVQRCNGLPVIFEHPERLLTTDEYRDRAIGTIVLPYATDTEVRGIAKIYDEDAAHLMMTTHASTSPAVVFRMADSTESIELSNGESVLIEGKPSYIDHLAICSDGVWDKGNGPSGINLGETTVTDEMKDEKRSDAESMEERMDALMKRMDAIENKGGDEYPTKEMRVDKKRADEEGKEEKAEEKEAEAVKELQEAAKEEKEAKAEEKKEEKKDSQARSDADLRSQIASLNARLSTLSTQPSMEERDAMASAQSRADKVARLFGDSVSPPVAGESSIEYRKRLAAKFQKHCDKFKSVRLDSLEGPVFDEVERTIYADAQTSALNPASAPEGRLIPDVSIDPAGRSITRYHGDPLAWMKHFMTGSQSVRFNRNSGKEIN